MRFASIPFRNLRRRPLRSCLTALGIAVAVGSFVALIGMSRGLELAWINALVERGVHMIALRKGTFDILSASSDERLADAIRGVEGVSDVSGELVDLIQIEGGESAILSGWPADSFLWANLKLRDGRLPRPDEARAVLLGQNAADALGKKRGDTIVLDAHKYLVTGTFRQAELMANSAIVLHLPAMQRMVQREGKVTVFNLRLKHPDDLREVAAVHQRLAAALPDLTFSETREVAERNDVLRLLRAIAWSTSAIALVMALVVVLNTLLMSVMERTREIGILCAVGWQAGRILGMVVLEGLALAVAGTVLGTLLGVGGLHWLAALPGLHGLIQPQVTAVLLVEVLAAALLLGVLGSAYPAWRAIRLDAVEALRYE